MATAGEYNQCGEELEELLGLKTSPIAVKMLEKESDIPETAIRPKRDRGHHLAQCCIELLKNPTFRKTIGKNARSWAVRERDWSKVIKLYNKVYSEL